MPLPLSLAEVEARLRSPFYRQPAAVAQDLEVIYENAVMFNGRESAIAQDAKGARPSVYSLILNYTIILYYYTIILL